MQGPVLSQHWRTGLIYSHSHTHIHRQFSHHAFRWWEETRVSKGNPHRHRENMQTPHRDPGNEPRPSLLCCPNQISHKATPCVYNSDQLFRLSCILLTDCVATLSHFMTSLLSRGFFLAALIFSGHCLVFCVLLLVLLFLGSCIYSCVYQLRF